MMCLSVPSQYFIYMFNRGKMMDRNSVLFIPVNDIGCNYILTIVLFVCTQGMIIEL